MNTKEVQALESYFNKLMQYVLPKTKSVKHTLGEPEPPKKNWFD